MKITRINRRETGFFSQQQLDFCYNPAIFSQFITEPFSIDACFNQMQRKKTSFSTTQRRILVDRLSEKLLRANGKQAFAHDSVLRTNIELLGRQTTFTIATGHQLVAMTGPLYLIYKIAHTIRLCETLKAHYPTYDFVPIFWLASEDHDYQEIRSFHLFNRSFCWDTDQSGAVGRFAMKDWDTVLSEFGAMFQNHPESEIFELLRAFDGESYSDAYIKLIVRLFGRYGLVPLDADDHVLKQQFSPYMEREVNERFSHRAIGKTTQKLVEIGGKEQIVPREINLFYLNDGLRERLIDRDTQIEIPSRGLYSKEEIVAWIREKPEEFSPNVSLRPLYQEVLLPNLCYIGGAGEINYWLQLKGVFDAVDMPFPLLKIRNSLLWIDQNVAEKMNKLQLSPTDMFKDVHVLHREYMETVAGDSLDFEDIDEQLKRLQSVMVSAATTTDTALESYALAESVRMEKQVQHFKEKLYKTIKSRHDKNLKTIQQLKEKLFPNGQLQERYTNFFQLTPDGNYSEVLDQIVQQIDPLSDDLIVVEKVDSCQVSPRYLSTN